MTFHVDPPKAADSGTEIQIQTRFRSRMKMLAPEVLLVAIPNGGKRTEWEKLQAAREGMRVGFPDIMAMWRGGTAYLEFKQRSGSPTDAQLANLNWLHDHGFPCGIFRSVDSAVQFIRDQGAPFLFESKVA